MKFRGETFGAASPSRLLSAREMLFVAEQSAEGGIKVLPGKEWGLHYPAAGNRDEKVRGVLDGKYKAEEVQNDLKPDALIYNAEDLQTLGVEAVSARIREASSYIANYDYEKFARFVESMRDRDVPLEAIDSLYNGVTRTRVQDKLLKAYGAKGKQQMEAALKEEVKSLQRMAGKGRVEKVLQALKLDWLHEKLQIASSEDRDRAVAELSGDERNAFNQLKEPYRNYVETGKEEPYNQLVDAVKETVPRIQKQPSPDEGPSESMQDLAEELKQFENQIGPPGSEKDPGIPPDDRDEYQTPPAFPGEMEKGEAQTIFEITPPLAGYYVSGRKSYFDVDTKTWSKKKQLSAYHENVDGEKRHTISGRTDGGIKSLPIPIGYALDTKSLQASGANAELFRDQNGCFYIKTDRLCDFKIDFLQEQQPFLSAPIPEDSSALYRGQLSSETESFIGHLVGGPEDKARQVRQHILSRHFYPGGGDLKAAQALQYKLREQSTGDNYLQNVDVSEYLECYSANTKFVGIMRKAGVPARLVVGHHPQGSKDGKTVMNSSTGHAWSEIWNGKTWIKFDATPNAKPEDKKDKEDDASSEESGGDESSSEGGEQGEQGEGSGQEGSGDAQGENKERQSGGQPANEGQSGNPTEGMSEVSDGDVQDASSRFDQAKEQVDQAIDKQKQLNESIEQSENFKDLADLKDQVDQSELFDDMKKDLEKRLDAKEEQMKEKLREEMDKMENDGFLDEKRREELEKALEEKDMRELDKLQGEIAKENKLYEAYDRIREEVQPLVEHWLRYFAERLPRKEEVSSDEDSLTRQGAFNRRSVMKPRNLIFGTVKNPRQIKASIEPRFLASIMIDVSGSMQGEKLDNARKLLVFYSELFSRISEEFGYIRFSIYTFSDGVTTVKSFKQDYDSPERYGYEDGDKATVKVRLMNKVVSKGGTNMLDAVKVAAKDLNEEAEGFPDHASAFYFVGDGDDTRGNSGNVKKFLELDQANGGFGDHMRSALLLGHESERRQLADIFGEEHTKVVPDMDLLIEQSMFQFQDDMEEYLRTKGAIA